MRPPVDAKSLPEDNGAGKDSASAGRTDVQPGARSDVADAPPRVPVEDLERRLRRMTRRGFAWSGMAAAAGLAGWRWLVTRSEADGLPWPLRRVLEWNERVARGLFRGSSRSPEFPRTAARLPRVNGVIGLESDLDPAAWTLRVLGAGSSRSFALEEIKALPRFEMTTELRCIEGWSEVVHWAGTRLADLASATGLATRDGEPTGSGTGSGLLAYAALETPDGRYYVGLDMASALHPQTLLCYEMNGRPLPPEHGAPLRLVIPLKYGIKNLKRIGTIRFTDVRPADYWAERGYDWYAGH
jgi:DMSO/TMAO reductase YedYZ molybdopterin-dependent catalytic subunit